jgi:peptide/nickel transport system substrate-binding protein
MATRTHGLWRRRVSRRGVARGAALTALAAPIATWAGCAAPSAAPSTASPAVGSAPSPASGGAASPTAAPTARPAKYGGAFRMVGTGDPPNLDLHTQVTLSLFTMGPALAYSKLLQYKADASVKSGEFIATGDLAESWQQADDTTFVFKLVPNAKWHNLAPVNGRPVVADDIKFSFERQLALKTNAAKLGGLNKIDVVDPQTVKLTLAKPDADFLATLADTRNKVVAREVVEQKGNLEQPPVIGSGAWIFERYERNTTSTLVRNPDHYLKGLPYVERLEFPRIPDPATQLSALRSQQLDVLGSLTPKDAETVAASNPGLMRESFKDPRGYYIAMNVTKAPFNNVKVRQAIFKAINKQRIIDTIFDGQAWYFPGIRMPSFDWYLPEDEVRAFYRQDVEGAKRLLAEAGYSPGQEFELITLNLNANPDIAQLVKADLDAVGVNVRIRLADSATFVTNTNPDGNIDLALSSTTTVSTTNSDLYTSHHSTATRNIAKIKDAQLDALIDRQAGMARDPEGRKRTLLELQRYVLNSAHHMHLVGTFTQRVRWKYVQDFYFTAPDIEESFLRLWLDK